VSARQNNGYAAATCGYHTLGVAAAYLHAAVTYNVSNGVLLLAAARGGFDPDGDP
jgi:hypothetical protein